MNVRKHHAGSAIFGLAMSALVAVPAVLATAASSVAQSVASDLPLVGYIANQTPEAQVAQIAAFRRGMEELGYVEGENIRYEWLFANADPALRGPIAAEMVANEPAVIVTTPSMGVFAAEATATVPIVVANLNQTRMAEIRALPNANTTGTGRLAGAPGIAEQLALALELVPVGANVGYLHNNSESWSERQRQAAEAAAAELGITLVIGGVQSVDAVGAGAQALVDQGVNVMVYGAGGFMTSGQDQMYEVARAARIPVIHFSASALQSGGLIALGVNNQLTFHGAAALVDRILKGANPADVPFAEVDAGWLAVNLTAAEAIGFSVPPAVLARANEVIE